MVTIMDFYNKIRVRKLNFEPRENGQKEVP